MPWIKTISLEDATGFLKKEYAKAIKRAGRIWNNVVPETFIRPWEISADPLENKKDNI